MRRTIALCALLLAGTLSLHAQGVFTGKWTIERAEVAPWSNKDYPPDNAEKARLLGKTLTFSAHRLEGPGVLGCKGPHYEMKDYSADMLFQGMIGETFKDPAKVEVAATKLGFKTRPIRTLETGCEGALDFHMSDPTHAAFALNNVVYWLKKQ